MELYHNSQSLSCRQPQGAQPAGGPLRLRVYVRDGAKNVTLRTWNGEETAHPMSPCGLTGWEVTITLPSTPCTLWYDFVAEDDRGRRLFCGNAHDRLGGVGAIYQDAPPSFQVTVYAPAFEPPEYLRRGVMYQIFPDRFHRSRPPESPREDVILHQNWEDLPIGEFHGVDGDQQPVDFFGGDLRGIEQKLPYLRDLGVSVLYLNPIFQARSNHRYDTGDYHRVDPLLGTQEDFLSLCRAAEGMGMEILLDGVFSHTGEDSLYFNKYSRYAGHGAYNSKRSKYYPWYSFTHYPDKYACWWNIPTLPQVNKDVPSFREFILGREGVVRRWLKDGASGWRLDVADELPMDFLRELRLAVKAEKPQAAILGEVWEDASNKVAYGQLRNYCLGDTLDSAMNYPLRDVLIRFLTGDIDAPQVVRVVRSLQENYPPKFFYSLMNLTGSHDRARALNVLVRQEYGSMPRKDRGQQTLPPKLLALAKERLKKLLTLLIALPGMPSIYYGDEAGMEGASDPFCRGTYPWGREDRDLQAFFREALRLRRTRPVLQVGSFEIGCEGTDTLLIYRGYQQEGRDVFGQPLDDKPYFLRLTRDAERL
ncbi:MAG: glycoside hydrolase family 13 protein [Christensenellales bacterium]